LTPLFITREPTPEVARQYIQQYSALYAPNAQCIKFESGEVVHFDGISDHDAVRVAEALLNIEWAVSVNETKH